MARIEHLLATGTDPGNAAFMGPAGQPAPANTADEYAETAVDTPELVTDFEQAALDQITARIAEEFTGHGLAALVSAVLTAEGFYCGQAPPGPDGGLTRPARDALRHQSLRVRVWEASEVVNAVLRTYDRLPEEIRTRLPLRRIWMLSDNAS